MSSNTSTTQTKGNKGEANKQPSPNVPTSKRNPDLTSKQRKKKLRQEGIIRIKSLETRLKNGSGKNLKSRYNGALSKWGVKNTQGIWQIGGLTAEEFAFEFPEFKDTFVNVDSGGNYIWNNQYVQDYYVVLPSNGDTLDLSKPLDRLRYYILLGWKEKSFSETSYRTKPSQLYYFYDESIESTDRNKLASLKIDAQLFVRNLDDNLLSDYAILFGYETENRTNDVLRSNLYDEATRNPEGILELEQKDSLTKVKITVTKALRSQMFTEEAGGIYYGEKFLGYNKDDAARNLLKQENEELLAKTISRVNVE